MKSKVCLYLRMLRQLLFNGVKGANGVILINTKRGKQGKPQVSFRTESAILSSLAERNYIDGYEYASLMNEGLANVGKAPRWSNEELEKFRTGSDPYLYPNVDWIDKVLNKKFISDNKQFECNWR